VDLVFDFQKGNVKHAARDIKTQKLRAGRAWWVRQKVNKRQPSTTKFR
jgi:hypothetical protein